MSREERVRGRPPRKLLESMVGSMVYEVSLSKRVEGPEPSNGGTQKCRRTETNSAVIRTIQV